MSWKRHLRAITRAGALIVWTLAMYAALISGAVCLFALETAAQRWRVFIFQSWAKGSTRILGIRIDVRGRAPAPPFLLVSNHLSYLDVLVLASQSRCAFVARGDLADWPVIGLLCRTVGTIFINRENRKDVTRVNGLIARALSDRRSVVLFAEGTSTSGDRVLPFKSSLLEQAARASFPVSCAALSYLTPVGEAPAHLSVCWWGEMTFVKHVIGLLYLTEIRASLSFGSFSVQHDDRKVLAKRLWSAVTKEFSPLAGRDFEDGELVSAPLRSSASSAVELKTLTAEGAEERGGLSQPDTQPRHEAQCF